MAKIDLFVSAEVSKEITFADISLIVQMADQMKGLLLENDYGDAVEKLAIIPTIFSEQTYAALPYKERKIYSSKKKEGEFRLKIEFNDFVHANESEKKVLILKNFIDSVTLLSKKVKKDFDGKRLSADVKDLFADL